MREFLGKAAKNGIVSYILNACAFILGIAALICYLVSAEDKSQMTETFISATVVVPLVIAVLANGAGIVYQNSLVKIGAFAMYFLSLVTWIFNQVGYIVNVFMGIDGNSFGFAYVTAFVLFIVCAVLSLTAVKNFNKDRQ
ncbi:MAG: hypothetical protein HFE48_05730 [Clostridia bacterium]|nr:hypothetical protein [Clostridia bacterium]